MGDCDWNILGNTKTDFKPMSSDGFAMAEFYTHVKNQLKRDDVLDADKDCDFSDDEDSGDNDEIDQASGYLHLARDPNIVHEWMRKIQTRHIEDKLRLMELIAVHASNKENLNIIVQ